MISRIRMAALLAAFALSIPLVLPAAAATITKEQARHQAEVYAKIRELKHQAIMGKAQQRMLRAMLAKNPKAKLPKGVHVVPPRTGEAGTPKEARITSAARAAELAQPSRAESGSTGTGVLAGAFGPNKRVNDPTSDLFTDSGQSETSMAAFGNNILVVWNDGNGFDQAGPPAYQLMSYGYSTDGGNTWTDGGTLPIPSQAQGSNYPNWIWTSDPVVTVNSTTGEFWFAGLCFPDGAPANYGFPGTNGDTSGVAVMKGTFSGSNFTWGAPKLVNALSFPSNFIDKQWLAVDPANGNLYLTYTRFTAVDDKIEFRRSLDGNTSWSTTTQLSAIGDNGWVQGSRIDVGPNSEVYAVWQAIGQTDGSPDFMKMRKSTSAGATWGAEAQAANLQSNFGTGAPGFNRERGITYPGLAIDRTNGPDRGRVYVCWNECINYWPEILFGVSTGNITEPETGSQVVNNTFATATTFTAGNTLRGTISNNSTDLDFFKFTATQGTTYIFWADSTSNGLDMAFRLFCSDQVTRLALSTLAVGAGGFIVWTCPANGTYYLRPAAWEGSSTAAPHPYRIRTYVHTPVGSDRARDSRDVFIASSTNGLTWPLSGTGAPTRVNDDAPYYDNWLPEIAVTGNSRVFCTWFDWRDAPAGTCGGQSNLYLYRSDNAGTNWSNLGLMTDATSAWTTVFSNVAPNQGDYISLFANFNGVYASWGDGRDANPNVYALSIPIATPTLASLATSNVQPDRVEMEWQATDEIGRPATLERRESSSWTTIDQQTVDGSGYVRFTDTGVRAGQTYYYRLSFDGGAAYSQEARIDVPLAGAFALAPPQPNPASKELWVSFTLPGSASATLSLVDITGRVVRNREVASLGPGTHRLNLGEGTKLEPGVYIVSLRQAGRVLTRRVSVVR